MAQVQHTVHTNRQEGYVLQQKQVHWVAGIKPPVDRRPAVQYAIVRAPASRGLPQIGSHHSTPRLPVKTREEGAAARLRISWHASLLGLLVTAVRQYCRHGCSDYESLTPPLQAQQQESFSSSPGRSPSSAGGLLASSSMVPGLNAGW